MEDYSISRDQMACEIEERDIMILAGYFDNVNFYLSVMGLSTSEQVDVRKMSSNQLAMAECLSLWRRHNPSTATLRALLEILMRLRKEEIASKMCDLMIPFNPTFFVLSLSALQRHTHTHPPSIIMVSQNK